MTEAPSAVRDDDEVVDLLIVDDRPEDLQALTTILANPGYAITTARSGPEALKLLLRRDFAVILLDVVMPTMDGFDVASFVKKRERSRDTPLIFLTALGADVGRIYRGYSIGAVDYLEKPVDPVVVRAKVAIFAELHRKDRRLQKQVVALREAERRAQELRIAELEGSARRRYANLAEAIPHIVWIADPDGQLRYANRRWVECTGIEIGPDTRSWLSALHTEDAERCASAWQQSLETGTPFETECRLRRARDGAYRWHLCRAVPEHDDRGRIEAWLGTYTDTEDLKQAVHARDEFLAVASHELRTPLTALKLRIQSILHGAELADPLRGKIENVARQIRRLERLINSLLDVSRITTGHLELELEEFDLAALARDVVERFRDEARAAGSELDLTPSSAVLGLWDRLRLEQVLTNLLSNAVKYGRGGPIGVRVAERDSGVELCVRDQGEGIAAEDLDRIFHQFERAVVRRARGGLGMGLYITRQIVDAHGGRVRVESQLGQGAEFLVLLPRQTEVVRAVSE